MRDRTGIKIKTEDGIEKEIVVETYRAIYPYDHMVRRVWAEPTAKGKRTVAYREIRSKLGDDWDSDITENWYMPGLLTYSQMETVSTALSR